MARDALQMRDNKQNVLTNAPRSFELRLKRTAKLLPTMTSEEPMWVLLSIFPEVSEDNEVVEIVGCFADIT